MTNLILDVRISNNKILHRAIGIVAACAKVTEREARLAILKAAHNCDTLTQDVVNSQDSAIIDVTFKVELVVPRAILVASGRYAFQTLSVKQNLKIEFRP